MIGRSLIIFQRGNNKNELHQVGSFDLAFAHREKDFDKKTLKEAKKKKWRPEAVVSDRVVKAIVNSHQCADPKEPGYHLWASDGYRIINLSGNPNLHNPLDQINAAREKERLRRQRRSSNLTSSFPNWLSCVRLSRKAA